MKKGDILFQDGMRILHSIKCVIDCKQWLINVIKYDFVYICFMYTVLSNVCLLIVGG